MVERIVGLGTETMLDWEGVLVSEMVERIVSLGTKTVGELLHYRRSPYYLGIIIDSGKNCMYMYPVFLASYEIFGKLLFQSCRKLGAENISLPSPTENDKNMFNELEVCYNIILLHTLR